MTSRVIRGIIWLVLGLVTATIFTFALLFAIVATSRYERTEGSCPDMPLDTLQNQVLLRLKDHGIPADGIRFDGAPQYHAWKLGMWEFPLFIDGIKYIAMLDCNEQLSSYWQIRNEPIDNASQSHERR
ncbi:hypothetical protein GWK53_21965 [Burkholderia cepacia]|uniref:hypothetical protein n=1 Tax=Burkholderia cepacia TaxID=292 RepID=UPI0013F43E57|nr:hypothetical protein [Burkholderia cepacia]NHB09164.1 hypothetical protein [Burkholderia cepacia]